VELVSVESDEDEFLESFTLYSVVDNSETLDIQTGLTHSGNFGYTLYVDLLKINKNGKRLVDGDYSVNPLLITLRVTNNEFTSTYKLNLLLDIIDKPSEHYNDLIQNFNLPTQE
jgi:hypothetical protein